MAMMERFKAGEVEILVCSDVAARGLDINNLSHVFNFDVPMHPDDYVHRIGRTGRAGKEGHAFTIVWRDDQKYIDAIETLTKKKIPLIKLEGFTTASENAGDEFSEDTGEEKKTKRKSRKKSAAKKSAAERPAEKEPRQKQRPSKEDDSYNDGPIVGMGNHMPAFLARPVK
jgi:ATP-dependent RNA helicase RhlE